MFIANREIKDVKQSESYKGSEMVTIEFSDGSTEEMTKALYDAQVTESTSDFTAVQRLRANAVVKDLLEVFLKWGVEIEDVNFMVSLLQASINASLNAADSKIWGKSVFKKNFIDIDRVLEKTTLDEVLHPENHPENGSN